MDEIERLLQSYHANTLMEMARRAGLPVKDEKTGRRLRKAALLKEMKEHFFTKERVQASWEKLSLEERKVVARLLLHRKATVSTAAFRRELVRLGLAKEAPEPKTRSNIYRPDAPYADGAYVGNPYKTQATYFEDVIARLTLHGIVFSKDPPLSYTNVPHKLQFHPGNTLFIPKAVRRHLPPPQEIIPPSARWQPKRTVEGNPEFLLRDLYIYWDFVRSHDVTFIKSGYIGKRFLKAVNKVLISPDPLIGTASKEPQTERLHLLRGLLMACGLLRRVDDRLLTNKEDDPLHIPDFWELTRAEQRARCIRAWPKVDAGGGLSEEAEDYGPDYAGARQTVSQALAELRPGEWVELGDFLFKVQEMDRGFLFPERPRIEEYRQRHRYGYYGYGYYENPRNILQRMDRYEDQFVIHCLKGFLNQIGLVELGYDDEQQDAALRGFRVVPSAARLLPERKGKRRRRKKKKARPAEAETAHEDDGGKLILQPNFQLMALGPVKFSHLAMIDLFADRERADVGAFEYRISRRSVYRAQQTGLEATEVIRFLEQHCESGIPQNVRRSLEEWRAHHQRIVFRSAVTLLQAADPALLRSLLDDPDVGQHLARPVTDTVALGRSRHGQSLAAALVKKGLFPAISSADPASADGSVVVEPDGIVRAIHTVPPIYLNKRLGDIAVPLARGEWQLTHAAVAQAGGDRESVLRILAELEALSRGPLPDQVVEWVKAWGGYYGQARADTVTLIEFRDRTALKELLDHPALKRYLSPFPTKDRALVVVPTDQLAQVKEILAERFGVRVTEGFRRWK